MSILICFLVSRSASLTPPQPCTLNRTYRYMYAALLMPCGCMVVFTTVLVLVTYRLSLFKFVSVLLPSPPPPQIIVIELLCPLLLSRNTKLILSQLALCMYEQKAVYSIERLGVLLITFSPPLILEASNNTVRTLVTFSVSSFHPLLLFDASRTRGGKVRVLITFTSPLTPPSF